MWTADWVNTWPMHWTDTWITFHWFELMDIGIREWYLQEGKQGAD